MIQVWTINILVMWSRGWTEKSQNGQNHHRTTAPKDKNQCGQNIKKMKIFFYSNHQGARSHFWSCDHMIQVWTINILVTRSRGRTEKRQNGQKHHRTTAPKDKNQADKNPKRCKYFATKTIVVHDPISGHVITWYRCGQSTFSSCGQVRGQSKAKRNKSTIGQQTQRIKIKAYTTPKRCKYFTAPTIKVHDTISGHLITWYRCGQSTFSSCGHVGGQRKAKMDKSTIGQQPQRIKINADKTPKRCKYFTTPTIKVHDLISGHVITWYRCGQSTFSSCGHVSIQRKAKMDKSTIGQQRQKINIRADKKPQKMQIFFYSNHQGARSHFWSCDHMIQVWTINILVMRSRGRTEKSQNGQKHHRTTARKDKNQGGQNPQKMKIFYYSNHQGAWYHFWSCDHRIQVWTINILVTRSRGWTEKRQNEQKHHRTTEPKDKNQGGQNPQKIQIFYYSNHQGARYHFWSCDHMIQVWTINILVTRSRGRTEKSQNGQKHHRTTAPKDKNQCGQNPQKIQIFYYSNHQGARYSFLIMWSHDTGVDNQHSCHCGHVGGQRKAKMDKSTIGQQPQRIKINADKTPKRCKYFNTPTIKVHDLISGHVITWYRCGQSTFSSCGHVSIQRKAKMDKSTIGQQPQRIKIKADKNPKRCKFFTTTTIKVHDPISGHVITWYRCGQSTFSSLFHVGGQRKDKMDKSTIGQQPQSIKINADKTPKRWKYFSIPTIKVHDDISGHVITWYRCGQSTFSSCGHVGGQRKAKMDKITIGQQPQRIKINVDKTLKRWKYFSTPTIKVHDPISGHVITWYRCGQSTFSSLRSRGADREEPKWTKAP